MPSVCQVSTIVADWRGKKIPNGVSVLIGDGNLRMTWGFVGSWGARPKLGDPHPNFFAHLSRYRRVAELESRTPLEPPRWRYRIERLFHEFVP